MQSRTIQSKAPIEHAIKELAPLPSSINRHHPPSQQTINSSIIITLATPRRVPDLADGQPPINVPVEHLLDQLDIRGGHDPRDAQFVVEDFVESVKEDAEGPDVLFLAAVGFALEDFGRGVI